MTYNNSEESVMRAVAEKVKIKKGEETERGLRVAAVEEDAAKLIAVIWK